MGKFKVIEFGSGSSDRKKRLSQCNGKEVLVKDECNGTYVFGRLQYGGEGEMYSLLREHPLGDLVLGYQTLERIIVLDMPVGVKDTTNFSE